MRMTGRASNDARASAGPKRTTTRWATRARALRALGVLLLAAPVIASIDSIASPAGASFVVVPRLVPSGARRPCPAGMVQIPGGTVDLLAPNLDDPDRPVTHVSVSAFCIDVTEVTQAAYEACAKGGSCIPAHTSCFDVADDRDYTDNCPCNSGVPDRQDHPANCIDVHESEAYCQALGKRLPTEIEWQWAATSATLHNKYAWGNDEPVANSDVADDKLLCWSGSYSRQTTCPVGQYPQGDTPLHLKDMAGNVYEWTASVGGADFPDCNGKPDCYVYRGGAAFTQSANYLEVTTRTADPGRSRWSGVGFRCAR